ncbi:thyroglobulin type-1 domain-containing protein [Caerostris extrusa]|uniref:Thyroglobulin type-1 domain-containing protein n=1 Tax=Caerostris extrusa TaxID=172846 RepID=A0AAV4SUS9_CAEEX|nr:thyroglobulin type-1 domain-containing protein [Caerostris extrusa]
MRGNERTRERTSAALWDLRIYQKVPLKNSNKSFKEDYGGGRHHLLCATREAGRLEGGARAQDTTRGTLFVQEGQQEGRGGAQGRASGLQIREAVGDGEPQTRPSRRHLHPRVHPDGNYVRAQCHRSPQFCWCVHPRSGSPIKGTTTQGFKPDCEAATRNAKNYKGRWLAFC